MPSDVLTAQQRYMLKNREHVKEKNRLRYRRKREEAKTNPEAAAKLAVELQKDKILRHAHYLAHKHENLEAKRASQNKAYKKLRNDPIRWQKRLLAQKDKVRQWRKNNPEKFKAGIIRWSKTENGRISLNASKVKSRKNNPEIAIKHLVRCRINMALRKGYKKLRSTREALGCDIPKLKTHLESLFQTGMNWENRGQWEIDHIRPCASFNLLDPEQYKCCFHYTNLQPLWRHENRAKGSKCL